MEPGTARPIFVSNFEAWDLLKSQREGRMSKVKMLTERKASRTAGSSSGEPTTTTSKMNSGTREVEDVEIERIVPQDLNTVTFECLNYLEASVHPVRRQTKDSIAKLVTELEKDAYGLTEADKLQIVNLAPISLVQLVLAVDDFEERFPTDEEREKLIELVEAHLGDEAALTSTAQAAVSNTAKGSQQHEDYEDEMEADSEDELVHAGNDEDEAMSE